MTTVDQVKEWFSNAWDESDGEFLTDYESAAPGEVIEVDGAEDHVFTIVEANADNDYNSYGYRSIDGFIIFSVDSGDELFKLPYTYESFEGESWDIAGISQVEKRAKVVTTWEYKNV